MSRAIVMPTYFLVSILIRRAEPRSTRVFDLYEVANRCEARTTAKGPSGNSIFASFDSTKGYVSALPVSQGGIKQLSLSV